MTSPALKLSDVARPEGGVFLWHGAGSTAEADHLIGLSEDDAADLAHALVLRLCQQRGPQFAQEIRIALAGAGGL
jgi:hypothetical protein